MEEAIMMIAKAMNTQKGDSLGVHALLMAVIKSLPAEQRTQVFDEFEKEAAILRSALADSNVEREIGDSFERFASTLEQRRTAFDRD